MPQPEQVPPIPAFLRRTNPTTTGEPNMQPHDTAAKAEPDDQNAELTKEQLGEMATAFNKAISALDEKIAKLTAERSEFKKKLRAVHGRLVTISLNSQSGA